MPLYEYEIGSTSSTTNVESLTTPLNVPRSTFQEWSKTYLRGDSSVIGHGFPIAVWQFSWLDQGMVDQLRTFCTAGNKSATVYIVTRRQDGTFAKYSCIMHWPDDLLSNRAMSSKNIYTDVTIRFTRLEAA